MDSFGERIKNARPLLVLVGPTGVGKTSLSIDLAIRFSGEIVSADSRLLYRGMDIGTAKPKLELRREIRHYLIDICHPGETLSLGQYKRLAIKHIDQIHERGFLPILVGGTGQYVRAIVEGWGIPEVSPNKRLRQELGKIGKRELYRWLEMLDPEAAEKIDYRNKRRVIRALEVTLSKGRPITDLQKKQPPDYEIKMIGLTCDRRLLYQRIDERVDAMMESGFLKEVEGLREAGYSRQLPAMSGLGYRQMWSYLEGEVAYDEAIERVKYETHRFARQQYTWFRIDDPDIEWFNIEAPMWQHDAEQSVREWLSLA